MRDYKKSAKITLIVINISIFLLFALAVSLPWLVTWFVEVRHKDAGLPALVMLICYPCLPFATVALFSIRSLLKNVINGLVFCDKNTTALKRTCFCCIGGAVITFAAGFFYLPFFVVSIAALGCGIIINTVKNIFDFELQSRREELYNSMKEVNL